MSNLNQIATDLLDIEATIAPLVLKANELKDILRDAVKDNKNVGFEITIPKKGRVVAKAASISTFKGVELKLGEKISGLTAAKRDALIKDGILSLENVYSRASKSSISVELN